MKRLLLFAIVVLGFSAASFGQANPTVSETASAAATIVAPIAIQKTVDLNFGNVAVSATTGGTVVMAADAAGTRTKSDGVSLPLINGTTTAAAFTVTGQANYTFSFTVPSAAITVANSSGDDMTIDTFTSSSTGVLTGGTQTVYVGAKLHVDAAQPTGLYETEDEFTVTVNYN